MAQMTFFRPLVHFGVSGVWIGILKPISRNIKSCILLTLVHQFQPNFAQWWRPPITLCWWSKCAYSESKTADDAIAVSKKSLSHYISTMDQINWSPWSLVRWCKLTLLMLVAVKNWRKATISKTVKSHISTVILKKIWHDDTYWLS